MCREDAGSVSANGGCFHTLRAPFGAARVPFLPTDSIFQEVCSMYQALYRKWRPKVFSDVIGQEHITETLK